MGFMYAVWVWELNAKGFAHELAEVLKFNTKEEAEKKADILRNQYGNGYRVDVEMYPATYLEDV